MKRSVLTLVFMSVVHLCLWAQTATVNLDQERQLIKGFGGINHPVWYNDLNASERDLCYGNGQGELGLTVLRMWISPDRNQWQLGLETAQRAQELGATIFASPWNPPAGMTYTDNNGQQRINTNSFGDYAQHLNDYVTYMRDNGVELYAVSTQNEPDYAHDWTEWTPQESVDFIKGYADQIDCRLMTPESFQYRKDIYDPILNDPQALANVDIFGTHLYGTQYSDFPYPLFQQNGAGKELWMTEVYTDSQYDANIWNDNVINEDHHALKVAEHIHHAMVEGQFQTYVFWPLRRYYALIHDGAQDQHGSSPAAAGTITKRGYCMGQFSKWIRPGFVRVEATKSPSNNVFVSAYKHEGEVVIVAVNKNTSSSTITLDIPGIDATTFEQYTTSASENMSQGSDINGGSSFQVTLDAASVTTFVGNTGTPSPTINLTSPTQDSSMVAPGEVYVEAEVSDPEAINTLEFFVNGEQTGDTEWQAPYFTTASIDEPGTYAITATMHLPDGSSVTSDTIMITANVPQGPYNDSPHSIPGIIQAEEFDVGGNSFAYNDNTPGSETGIDFRADEEVDIEETEDTDGEYNIGYATSGEWLEYTVNVSSTGEYDLDLRVARDGDDGELHIEMDGEDITGTIAVPNTGGWQTWETVTLNDINLDQGEHIMRIVFDSDYMNLNYVEFYSVITSISGEDENTVKVYPNPFTSEGVTIRGADKASYRISDVSGRKLESGFVVGNQTVGSGLLPGVYFITIETDKKNFTHKIIKK